MKRKCLLEWMAALKPGSNGSRVAGRQRAAWHTSSVWQIRASSIPANAQAGPQDVFGSPLRIDMKAGSRPKYARASMSGSDCRPVGIGLLEPLGI